MNTRLPNQAPPGNRPYSSARREAGARHTRERVIAAGTALFSTEGFDVSVRAIATRAGVATATVELLFGTKAALLSAVLDVALAGDHEPVPVLDRPWVRELAALPPDEFLRGAGTAFAMAADRAAPLLQALEEGARRSPELARLSRQRRDQRHTMAQWVVDTVAEPDALARDLTRPTAVATVHALLDPVLHRRLLVDEEWSAEELGAWLGRSLVLLLLVTPPVTELSVSEDGVSLPSRAGG